MLFVAGVVDTDELGGFVDFAILVGGFLGRAGKMRGVRASSIKMESTSSTMATWWPRWTTVREVVFHVVAELVEQNSLLVP